MTFSSGASTRWHVEPAAAAGALFLFSAIIFGGGGAEAPLVNGILELLAALLLAWVCASHFHRRPLPSESAGPLWCTALILGLIGSQLIPLPPEVWATLPGRENASAVHQLIGDESSWRSLSLDPEATRRQAAALILPVALLLSALAVNYQGLVLLVRTLVIAALVSALVGAFQIALGNPMALAPFGQQEPGVAYGVFANPNHHGQFMLAALVATGLLIRLTPAQIRIRASRGDRLFNVEWLLLPIFIAMAAATHSRAALLLLPLAVAAAAIIALRQRGGARLFATLAFVGAAALALAALMPRALERAILLQSSITTGRGMILPDALYTAGQYWPWGSGFGTFVPVYQANEDLELLQPLRVNHAHNDLLELIIEAGLPGLLVLGIVLIGIFARLLALVRTRPTADPGPAIAGFAILLLMFLHSLVDYPLRVRSLAAVAAIAVALTFSPAQQRPASETGRPKRQRRSGFRRPQTLALGSRTAT